MKSLLVRDIKKLSDTMDDAINYVDVDYDLKRPADDPWTTHTRSSICRNDYAILNAYRMWLQSKHYDYLRNPQFGGLFEYNLNDKVSFSVDNESTVQGLIINESADKWPGITILECEVKAIIKDRRWYVRIIAQDKGTKLVLNDEQYITADDPNR